MMQDVHVEFNPDFAMAKATFSKKKAFSIRKV
jgi:hypothetical protein